MYFSKSSVRRFYHLYSIEWTRQALKQLKRIQKQRQKQIVVAVCEEAITVPQAVVEKHILENMSLVRAWREHLGLSQQEVAQKMGISQSAYSQMETAKANLRQTTVNKITKALGILPEQLEIKTITANPHHPRCRY